MDNQSENNLRLEGFAAVYIYVSGNLPTRHKVPVVYNCFLPHDKSISFVISILKL